MTLGWIKQMTKGWICAIPLALLSSAVHSGGLTLGAGAEYTSGKYTDTETTEMLYFPFFGRYESGPWITKVTVPFIWIEGPSNVVGTGEDVVVLPGSGERRTDAGLGDVVASAFLNLLHESDSFIGIDIGAKVKLGTADESIGTGELDYAVQTDLFKPLGSNTLFASLGHRWYGDPPGSELRNVFYGSLGVSRRFSPETSGGIAYDYRPSIVPNGGEISELTAFWSHRVSPRLKLQPYALIGFGEASPDFGAGAQIAYLYSDD
jgi:hypothetical protein